MTLGPLPRMTPKQVGGLTVHSLLDSVGPTRVPEDMLKGAEPETAGRHGWVSDYLAEDGRMLMAYQSFLILTPEGRSILVDCAVGEDGEFPFRPDWHRRKSNWLAHLGQAGLTPEDVDVVFLTHLHFDHTGWLTRLDADEWVPTFPNAQHVASGVELDHWAQNHPNMPGMTQAWTDSVAPVLDRIERVAPGDTVEGLRVVDLAGHSPGMIGLEAGPEGRPEAAFNADLMHHPLQMAEPDLPTVFCSDPEVAVATRRAKLRECADAETVMFCNHFPGECAGLAVADGEGWRFAPA